jgi:hypothetical protein
LPSNARFLIAFVLVWAAAAQAPSRELFEQIDGIARELESISGLTLKHKVPSDYITRDRVNAFLKQRIKEVASPEEIRAEELALKKFGLVPPDFDLARSTVDLLTEQAAAFYDYNRKKLFVTESSTSPETQMPVLVHELAHALADQHFNLAKYIRQGRKNDDGAAARLAVMEGQASWLMAEYVARKTGQSLATSPGLLAMMSRMDTAAGQYPVFDTAPLYLRLTLIFPYTKGMLFQHAVVQKHGKGGFAEVFRQAPRSTQQILHPEKYAERLLPSRPALPQPPKLKGYKQLVGGSLGELDHAVLLEQYSGRQLAESLAPHWRGSQFVLLENRKENRTVLLYSVEWDDIESARRYFRFYREALSRKWKKMVVSRQSIDELEGLGDDGRFVLTRSGALITSVEGLPSGIN